MAVMPLVQAPGDTTGAPAGSARPRPGDDGRLYLPGAAGRPRTPTRPGDASEEIKLIEQKLACHCGCTLDIFTCRTTDFTCTTSPRLHAEVVALYEGGASGREIIDHFKAAYGEQALMAPEPEGFNLAGYFVPGIAIVLMGSVLTWVVSRRLRLAPAAVPDPTQASEPAAVTAEAEARLRQALAEVED
ncbi:MAG TPA: cytochrome c-type biogenesis protein CcmH [Gemmatimonadales bacterium]|nr:cytochrome c-type biogenesis protein CcmH [Gemmatimonadales bacterium]